MSRTRITMVGSAVAVRVGVATLAVAGEMTCSPWEMDTLLRTADVLPAGIPRSSLGVSP